MAFVASHKYARISARKVRPVADLVRGLNVNRALELLEFNPRRGAFLFKQVIKSAVANAAQDADVNVNQLVLAQCYVNDGPLLHRPMGRFVARGRWHPIRKRTSHLHVVLDESAAPGKRGRKGKSRSEAKAGAGTAASSGSGGDD